MFLFIQSKKAVFSECKSERVFHADHNPLCIALNSIYHPEVAFHLKESSSQIIVTYIYIYISYPKDTFQLIKGNENSFQV